jgi:hypothetical protein
MGNITVKAAVVQAAPILFDTSRTLEKLADLMHDASAQGADLVVFPEAFIGGYPKELDIGARQSLKRKRWPGQTRKRLRRASGCRRPSFRQGKPRRLRYLTAHTALIAHYFPPAAGAATENPLSGVF